MLGWLKRQKRSSYREVDAAEIASALEQLRIPGGLCFVQPKLTNEGVALEVSFNEIQANTNSGRLELALREARLNLDPHRLEHGWSWDLSLRTLTASHTREIENTVEIADRITRSDAESHRDQRDAGLEAGVPSLVKGKASLQSELQTTESSKKEKTRSASQKGSVTTQYIEIDRLRNSFRIGFYSPSDSDLIRLNPDLMHIPVLSIENFDDFHLDEFSVTLHLRIRETEDMVISAFRVRDASGIWTPLLTSRNRQIIGEQLISDFLQPLHNMSQLWPAQPGAARDE